MRTIDADYFIERLDACDTLKGIGLEPVMSIRDIKALISVMPEVDAVPVKHGRWKLFDSAEPQRYGCSNCSCLSWYGTYRYCPNCGSRMDLEGQDADNI